MKTGHKELYEKFVVEQGLPIFCRPDFLDVVCEEGIWDVSLVLRDNKVVGAWPFYKKKKYGLTTLTQPMLVPYLGPFISVQSIGIKNASKLSFEKKVLSELADGLPMVHREVYHGHPQWINWKPLHWKGYQQSTRYTYQIDLTQKKEIVFQGLTDKTRNIIKGADLKFDVAPTDNANLIYNLVDKTFQNQNLKAPYSFSYFEALHDFVKGIDAYKSYVAYSKIENDKTPVAVVYMIYDRDTAYLLVTGRVGPEAGGAVSSLIWKCIQEAQEKGLHIFDFEGSMVEGIDSFFRSFGGSQVPYHRITKTSNRITYALLHLLNRI